MKTMKTVTIGGTTYEIVDEQARAAPSNLHKKIAEENCAVYEVILELFQKAVFTEAVTALISKLALVATPQAVQQEDVLTINQARVTRADDALVFA